MTGSGISGVDPSGSGMKVLIHFESVGRITYTEWLCQGKKTHTYYRQE